MPITIPQSVFEKYFDVVDSTFNIFGVTCQLVYIEKVEVMNHIESVLTGYSQVLPGFVGHQVMNIPGMFISVRVELGSVLYRFEYFSGGSTRFGR